MLLLITFMLAAITVSFICSIMEAVLLCITPSFVATLQADNPTLAKQVKDLRSQIDRPLAAILTLNTIAHTAGAAGVGAQAAFVFGDGAVGIASAIMTLFVLIFSEIIPKTLGANYWRQLAGVVCRSLLWLIPLLKPFVWMSEQLTKLFSSKKNEADYIRAEIEAMAALGSEQGVVAEDESSIISSLLRFRHTNSSEVLTPRSVLFRIHKDMTVEEYLEKHGSEPFSRIVITDKDDDDVVGYVLKNDIMLAFHRLGANTRVSKLKKTLYTVPETIALPKLFSTFIEKHLHICLVVDEYGDVQGIITLEDMLECLLGVNIIDERDRVSNMRQKAIQMWRQRVGENENLIDDFGQSDTQSDSQSSSQSKPQLDPSSSSSLNKKKDE